MHTVSSIVSILFAALAALLCGCQSPGARATARPSAERGIFFDSVTVGGTERKYAVYVPREYNPSQPMPAIIFLNGSGECGTDGQKQLTQGLIPAALSDKGAWPFIIICPQKPESKSQWIDHDDMVMAILASASRQWELDSKRMYLTGLSQGGAGTWAIAAKHPEVFAAIAPVCGYGSPTSELGQALKMMPIWAFHGAKDNVVPPAQTEALVNCVKAAGGEPAFTLFPDANHNSWDGAYRTVNLGKWFLTHHK
jgi:predicted peptidase